MSDPTPVDNGKPPTRWGDREQRRIDILDAARALVEGPGYVSLSMRTLAADAGISPATLYSYFATKEELFATLYVEAIRAHTDAFRPVSRFFDRVQFFAVETFARFADSFTSHCRYPCTSRPMARAEPMMIFVAASRSLALRSFIFASAISRHCAVVTVPATALPGV